MTRLLVACSMLLLAGPPFLLADDEILPTTTEFGITITPTQIYDVMQESQDFWTPVRHYIASDRFPEADPAVRRQAAEFIRKVNDRLLDQMFGRDEQAAVDLVDYLSTRLRLIALFRQLRETLDDDELVLVIKSYWEQELRRLSLLTPDKRRQRIAETDADMGRLFSQLGLADQQAARSTDIWHTVVQVSARLNGTAAGQIMLEFEREVHTLDPALKALICDVVATADWADITRQQGELLTRQDFERAWVDVKRSQAPRAARLAEHEKRRPTATR